MEKNRITSQCDTKFTSFHIPSEECPILCITKSVIFVTVAVFILCLPLGDPNEHGSKTTTNIKKGVGCTLCDIHNFLLKASRRTVEVIKVLGHGLLETLYETKLKFYALLERIDRNDLCRSVCCSIPVLSVETLKETVDEVIEDQITQKLGEDLLQSIEKKFQVDLEKSVDLVLVKIKMLLQNGTSTIQEKLMELQSTVEVIKNNDGKEFEECLAEHHNETSALAEKALHQMVVCGYALIGHDPAQAVAKVLELKTMISQVLKPIYAQKREVYGLLKVCGHDHETLKKVIKCVISKSPLIKSAMMEVTNKLIDGVVDLTKLMAHGAMHEACLIEVIKATEEDGLKLINTVQNCVYANESLPDLEKFIKENNATVLDLDDKRSEANVVENNENVKEMRDLIRRMLKENNAQDLDKTFKKKLVKLQKHLSPVNDNIIVNEVDK